MATVDYMHPGSPPRVATVRQTFPSHQEAYDWVDRLQEAFQGAGTRCFGYQVIEAGKEQENGYEE